MANIAVHGGRTRTLTQLMLEVREISDTEADDNITDAELTRWLNQAAARWWGMLARARGEAYLRTSSNLSTVAGTATVALPTDFFKLHGLQWDKGSDKRQKIHRIELQEYLRLDVDSRNWDQGRVRAMIEGSNLRFHPTPNTVETVICWYSPVAPQLSAGSDTLEGINGWEDWVVLTAAIRAINKQERDPAEQIAERKEIERDINTLSSEPDEGEPQHVIDVDTVRIADVFPEYRRV